MTPWLQAHDSDEDNDSRHGRHHSAAVFPPQSHPYGLSYPEWHIKWWQWSISIPSASHPYGSAEFAGANQSGPVWFLVGFSGEPRSITIPQGKAIFFPLVNTECSNVEQPPFFGANETEMRAAARLFVRTDLSAEVDGLPVRNPERFEAETALFDFTAPEGNILTGGPAVSGQAVDAGAYLMLPPLSVGYHTIHFKGTQTDPLTGSFVVDAVYHITVTPHHHRR